MKLKGQTILLTGGTGSFGRAFISELLKDKSFHGTIRVFSRDEFKQYELEHIYNKDKRLRFFIGDVRELDRLKRATYGVDIVIHAAALKQVPILEYNPFEAVKTNIIGSQNVIESAIELGVKKAILISSDKAVSPINLYGCTKMVAERLFVHGNSYVGTRKTVMGVVRYGNVMGSRGSVLPLFLRQAEHKTFTITHPEMTRFWLTLNEGVNFVLSSLGKMKGGEIFVPKIPSVKVIDIAKAVSAEAKIRITGIRPGEKLHEVLINSTESRRAIETKNHFRIESELLVKSKNVKKYVDRDFIYSSDNNDRWLTIEQIKGLIAKTSDANFSY